MEKPRPLAVRMLEFVKFSHTIFALPFALASAVLATQYDTGFLELEQGETRMEHYRLIAEHYWPVFLLVLGCMVFARTAAMAFNRVADWEIDKGNPRTAGRHRLVTRPQAVLLIVLASAGFVACAWLINEMCFLLSPLALALIFAYSLTKRFTSFSHFFLGLALAAAPMGAWIAVTGAAESLEPWLLSLAVFFWVAGFDIIYATQDHEHDSRAGLHSMVVRLGVRRSLALARFLHGATVVTLVAFGIVAMFDWPWWVAMASVLAVLAVEHRLAARLDPVAINRAFFQANAVVSVAVLLAVVIDVIFFQ